MCLHLLGLSNPPHITAVSILMLILGLNLRYVTILNISLLENNLYIITYYNEAVTQSSEHAVVSF